MKNKYLPSEWNNQEFIQLVFPHKGTDWIEYLDDAINTFITIAKAIQLYQKCLIITQDIILLKDKFENTNNLIFIQIDSNDTWSRDFGGITIIKDNIPTIIDFQFNGWGDKFDFLLDNNITKQLKSKNIFQGYDYVFSSFVLEGGAIDINDDGILLTTSRCLLEKNRNPTFTKPMIEKKLFDLFGLSKILWLNYGLLTGDDTDGHIDTLARFISNNTIVYQSCDDKNDPHFQELYKMRKELEGFRNLHGDKFELIPLPWIKNRYFNNDCLPATYVNFLIINGAVLVPTYKDKNDIQTLNIFQKLYPNRDIIAIDCTTLIKQHGSLHCVTMQYPKLNKKVQND